MGILNMKLGKADSSNADFGLVGQGIEVNGDIVFADQLHVYGKVTGKLASKSGTLVIGESGELDAQVDVGVCVVHGNFRGNVTARTKLEIRRTGKVTGDVVTPVLLVEEGAVFNGVIRMGQEASGRILEEVPQADGAEAQRQARRA
jgi:cytoskeletal protein CcmA (bactofilin family)